MANRTTADVIEDVLAQQKVALIADSAAFCARLQSVARALLKAVDENNLSAIEWALRELNPNIAGRAGALHHALSILDSAKKDLG